MSETEYLIRKPPGKNPLDGLLTVQEAAEVKRVNPRYVTAAIERGVLAAWTIGGRYLIPESELAHWKPGTRSYRHGSIEPLRCKRCNKALVRTRLLKSAPDYCSLACASASPTASGSPAATPR